MSNSLRPCQALLSTGFSRQEYWSGLLLPSQRDLLDKGSNTCLLFGRQIHYHWATWEGHVSSLRRDHSMILLCYTISKLCEVGKDTSSCLVPLSVKINLENIKYLAGILWGLIKLPLQKCLTQCLAYTRDSIIVNLPPTCFLSLFKGEINKCLLAFQWALSCNDFMTTF